MKRSKFTEAQIVFAIKQSETVPVEEVCRKLGISQATFTIGRNTTAAWMQQSYADCISWKRKTAS